MEQSLQILLQGGALAILAYLVVWVTRIGVPQLFDVLVGIRQSMDRHTGALEKLEASNERVVAKIAELAEDVGRVKACCPIITDSSPDGAT